MIKKMRRITTVKKVFFSSGEITKSREYIKDYKWDSCHDTVWMQVYQNIVFRHHAVIISVQRALAQGLWNDLINMLKLREHLRSLNQLGLRNRRKTKWVSVVVKHWSSQDLKFQAQFYLPCQMRYTQTLFNAGECARFSLPLKHKGVFSVKDSNSCLYTPFLTRGLYPSILYNLGWQLQLFDHFMTVREQEKGVQAVVPAV